MHTHTQTYMHTNTCMYTHINMLINKLMHMWLNTHICTHTHSDLTSHLTLHFSALICDGLVSQRTLRRDSRCHTHTPPLAAFSLLLEVHRLKSNNYSKYCQHDLLSHKVGEKEYFSFSINIYVSRCTCSRGARANRITKRSRRSPGLKSADLPQWCILLQSLFSSLNFHMGSKEPGTNTAH